MILIAVVLFCGDLERTSEVRAAVVWDQLELQLDRLHCLSVDPRKLVFNERQYPGEKLVSTIGAQLAIPRIYVNANVAECPWGFSLSGEKRNIFAVRYREEIAHYVLSVGICERKPDGTLNPDRCLAKSIYIFNHNAPVDALFLVSLTGLARKQTSKWEAFQVEGTK